MDKFESLNHTKWDCKYHVVFIPKGRRKVLYAQLTALTAAVDEVTKRLQFFRGASMLVAKTVASKVKQDGMSASYQDLNAAAHALGRMQEAVLGKAPDTTIVNTNAVQNTLPLVYTAAEVRAIHDMLESQC